MQSISREWWIGYTCSLAAGLALIVLAWLHFIPRAKVATPSDGPTRVTAADLRSLTVDELVAHVRLSRERIRSYRMRVAWEDREIEGTVTLGRTAPKGIVRSAGSGLYIEDGIRYRVERHWDVARETEPSKSRFSSRSKSSGNGAVQDVKPAPNVQVNRLTPGDGSTELVTRIVSKDGWCVFDGRQRAEWHSRHNKLYLRPREFIHNLAALRHGDLYPGPLRWGFGTRYRSLEENIDANPDHTWTASVEDAEGGPRYVVRGIPDPAEVNRRVRMEYTLDPLRDYLIRRIRIWRDDTLVRETTIIPQQAPGNFWYPQSGIDRNERRIHRVEFSDAEFNEDFEDALFHWENMPFDAETVELHKQKGTHVYATMRFQNGKWQARF